MNDYEMKRLQNVRNDALDRMRHWGLASWAFRYNRRVHEAGACILTHDGAPGRIELSEHFVLLNEERDVIDTILHEIAHALSGSHVHDGSWRNLCRIVGATPTVSCRAQMPLGNWMAACSNCRMVYRRHRRPRPQYRYLCKVCHPVPVELWWEWRDPAEITDP